MFGKKKDDNSSKEILDKLDALRNLKLDQDGLLIAKDFHKIINAQMDLTTSLFERLHKDVRKISKSSRLLEILTSTLIVLTAVLIAITIIPKL